MSVKFSVPRLVFAWVPAPASRIAALLAFAVLPLACQAQTATMLFDFTDEAKRSDWQIVNDGVMGGLSSSQFELRSAEESDGVLDFTGTLSLENNGGFASIRSIPSGTLGLEAGDTLVMRVKGDGRRYTANLYVPDNRTAFAYQQDFETTAEQWIEVRLPVDKFVAHSFGRPRPDVRLEPARVHSLGILLGDKKAGPFRLLVDSISIED